ncbi:kinase-like domain-containing protein [Xylaria castorea]|nr:kinase-like domain-containing protein [Xylaria castorea]
MTKTRSLYEDIDDSMELRNDSSARFLPAERLGQLLTKEAVTMALEPCKPLSKDINMEALVRFVCTEARIVFAILVWNENESLIFGFYRAQFTDKMLPVARSGEKLSSFKKRFTSIARSTFSGPEWTRHAINSFYDYQWPFLSPVFRKDRFHYKLLGQHHMPFLQKIVRDGGRYGEVTKCILHRDHLDINIDVMHNENHQPIIAIKELKKHDHWSDNEFRDHAKREADVLKMMRQFPHEHFIKIIAYCEINERRYFLFPWAEYGNLQQYWSSQTPDLDEAYLKWVFSQLMGLAGAIQQLHEKGGCRHGDIKSQNILCFKDTSAGANNYPVRLVIADLGLAKVHDQATMLRSGVTTTKNHTIMYSAPEVELNTEPRSRLYDVWSIGCTYLEFIIWLLWRKPELDRFQSEVGGFGHRGTFYDIQPGQEPPACVHSTVNEWMEHIRDDPRCSPDTGLRRLIDLIATRLLIVALPGAAPKLTEPFNRQINCTEDSFQVLVQRPTLKRDATSNQPVRATAEEMHHDLRSINSDVESKRCKLINDSRPVGEPPHLNNKLALPSSAAHAIGTGIRKLVVR